MGSTGGFDHHPKLCPPCRSATWWSTISLIKAENPHVISTPSIRRHNANAIANPESKQKEKCWKRISVHKIEC